MLTALIMAGGKGTRFWPLSTEEKPKQFLKLIGEETMIQMTVNRIKPIIPLERIFICTGRIYVKLVKEQIPDLPERNIIIEPEGRNTAPCIALSAMIIDRYYKNSNMVVLPSDHLIKVEDEFRNTILAAHNFICNKNEAIITLGMNPTRAEVGYGYIKYSNEILEVNDFRVIKVDSFVEKPNLEKARKYLRAGVYLWNGGMFIWSIKNIINQIKMYSYNTYDALKNIMVINEEELQENINNNYERTEAISIDYAVLEKSKDVYVIPSNFGWDDVGSWESLDRYMDKDIAGNVLIGRSKVVKANNNLVISSNNSVIVEGLSDIYVIENDGKVLVGHKSNIANVTEFKNII
ncbi:mannose-1-phosphate guanylyltransferase/mannose-6-phosphate isomerase [Clostridium butyricum 60E.3]|uniref:mannose-1-phosphate guanylyltransferase n=1 Tax=Clostridium butyricum TaxID=1492 RepID=UPI0002D1F177|nr:mannose-1-phosphate guanylyltransferase [Clostridium butyricum]ENZ30808.1 mannose-1-phosphate guanylyltransferase/mannose-6-phosphate isomerase [Clostridium butyricum 60E.3]